MLEDSWEFLDCKEIKPVNYKENQSRIFTEDVMLKLKLQYFGHLLQRAESLEKNSMLGKIEGRKKRGRQRTRWLNGLTDWTWVWASSRRWWRIGEPGVFSLWGHRVRLEWTTEQQQHLSNSDLACAKTALDPFYLNSSNHVGSNSASLILHINTLWFIHK